MADKIFLLAIFLIPFDNLFFAPSAGWATISPILFFIYLILNLNDFIVSLKETIKFLGILWIIIIHSLILYFFYHPVLSNVFDTFNTLILGYCFYLALHLRYNVKRCEYKRDLNILLTAYTISFIYGLIKFIALKFGISSILNVFSLIEKRYYNRLAFSFTEPSFISMHVWGILFCIYAYIKDKKISKRLLVLIGLFVSLTILASQSTRSLIDMLVIMILVFMRYIFNGKVNLSSKVIFILFVIFLSPFFINNIMENSRVNKVVNKSVYDDPSAAARFFRVNASIKGYMQQPVKALFGAGFGNSYVFFEKGYDEARFEYESKYLGEINQLAYSKPNQLFNMYIRLFSEVGFLWTFILISVFILHALKYKGDMYVLLVLFYLYVQFDSYAFYSIPLYIFLTNYSYKCRHKNKLSYPIN